MGSKDAPLEKALSQLTEGMCVLYPAGGTFNKLRPQQQFLRNLLESSLDGYNQANDKGYFIETEILARIPGGGLHICTRDGTIYRPDEVDAREKIMQFLRDLRKRTTTTTTAAPPAAAASCDGSPTTTRRRTSSPPRDDGGGGGGGGGSRSPSTNNIQYIMYPSGGAFNQIRRQNPHMGNLLRQHLEGYTRASRKREYIRDEVLPVCARDGGLQVCNRDGALWTPARADAIERIGQRFRDMRKRVAAGGDGGGGRKRKSAAPKPKNLRLAAIRKHERTAKPSSTGGSRGASSEPAKKKRKSRSRAASGEEGGGDEERTKYPRSEEEEDDDDDKEPLDPLEENFDESSNTKDLIIECLRNTVASQKKIIDSYEQQSTSADARRQRQEFEDQQLEQRNRELELKKQTAQRQLQELQQKYRAVQAENEFLIDREVQKQQQVAAQQRRGASQQRPEPSETRLQEKEQQQQQQQQPPPVAQPRSSTTLEDDDDEGDSSDTEKDRQIASMQLEIQQLRELLLWQGSVVKEKKKQRSSMLLNDVAAAATDDSVAAAAAPATARCCCRELREQCQANEAEILRLGQDLRQKETQSLALLVNERQLHQQCQILYEACLQENGRLRSSVVQLEGLQSAGQARSLLELQPTLLASQAQVVLLQSPVGQLTNQVSSLKKDQEEPEQEAAAISPSLSASDAQ